IEHNNTGNYISIFTDAQEVARFNADGSLDVSGAVNQSQGFDIAESYPTFDEKLSDGDLVMITDNLFNGDQKLSVVARAEYINRDKLVGIVSTSPGFTMGGGSFAKEFCEQVVGKNEGELEEFKEQVIDQYSNSKELQMQALEEKIETCQVPGKVLLALAGRVPVNIDLTNGEVKSGDPLTVSPVIGKAMRANTSGMIVGRALEGYTEEDKENGDTSIMAMIQVTYWSPKIATLAVNTSVEDDIAIKDIQVEIDEDFRVYGKSILGNTSILGRLYIGGLMTIDSGEINSVDTLEIQPLSMADILFQGDRITMTTEGDLIVLETVTAKQFAVDVTNPNHASAGEGIIPLGDENVFIN
ncbi:MAG: hypothetical protein ACC656_14610, partial [Candidatus Heimdallarchaeota archaeon]